MVQKYTATPKKDLDRPLQPQIYNILLVDNSPTLVDQLTDLLDQAVNFNYELQHVFSLIKAKECLLSSFEGVVLLSTELKDLQSFEALDELIVSFPHTIVIAVIEHEDEKLEMQLFEHGAQDVIALDKMTSRGIARAIRQTFLCYQTMCDLQFERETLTNLARAISAGNVLGFEELLAAIPENKVSQDLLLENKELLSKVKTQNDRLHHLAHYDVLTSLPNRASFESEIQRTLARSQRHGVLFAVLFVDLDKFKFVNDSFGHHVGDELLRQVAVRLQSKLRYGDFIARLGGDEFAIILHSIKYLHAAGLVAHKLVESMRIPFSVLDQKVQATCTIGIACFPNSGRDIDHLLRNADFAMYRAKEQGGNSYQYSSEELHDEHMYRMQIEVGLRNAIEKEEFYLLYQPIYSLPDIKLIGMEALLRWENDKLGFVPPDIFVPVAEDAGLIIDIGHWVMRKSCQQYQEWLKYIDGGVRLAINLSPRQTADEDLQLRISEVLRATGLPSRYLELEVTEMAVMAESYDLEAVLLTLSKMGISSSMDDFGTGYLSLSRLRKLPISTLKIDGSFIDGIDKSPDDEAIIKLMIALADKLNLSTVAESVETEGQLKFLIENNCTKVQGFYFNKPLTGEAMTEYLKSC